MEETIRERLVGQLDQARWEWLKPHHERGAVFLVDPMLDLITVAERVACDDSAAVSSWLASHCLARPDEQQVALWAGQDHLSFQMVVVHPYVLIQEYN